VTWPVVPGSARARSFPFRNARRLGGTPATTEPFEVRLLDQNIGNDLLGHGFGGRPVNTVAMTDLTTIAITLLTNFVTVRVPRYEPVWDVLDDVDLPPDGWMVTQVFVDRPMPIRKGKERRPGEAALLDMIRSSGVQRVLVWSIDPVGRSLDELVGFIETCRVADVGVYLHEQGIDTAGSNGMSMFDFGTMMAFHLRQSRRDRILRGQAAARAASVRFGRPPIAASKVEKAKQGLAAGKGVRAVARLAGISAATVSRLKGAMEQVATAD
jgi:DNA invertase Pin-like site-specific DNA recombinase